MPHLDLKKPEEKLKIVDYRGERIIHFESGGEILGISGASPEMIDLIIGEYDDIGVFIPKKQVKQLINYLQAWLDTGSFEGERKEENDS